MRIKFLRRRLILLLLMLFAVTIGWVFGFRGGLDGGADPPPSTNRSHNAHEDPAGAPTTQVSFPSAALDASELIDGEARHPEATTGRIHPAHTLIHGNITDEKGQALVGVMVHLITQGRWNHLPEVLASDRTNDEGRYHFYVPPPPSRHIQVLCVHETGSVRVSKRKATAAFGVARIPEISFGNSQTIAITGGARVHWALRPIAHSSETAAEDSPFPMDMMARVILVASTGERIIPQGVIRDGETIQIAVGATSTWELLTWSEGTLPRVTRLGNEAAVEIALPTPMQTQTLHVAGDKGAWALIIGGVPRMAQGIRARESCEVPTAILQDPDAVLCLRSGTEVLLAPLLAGQNIELPLTGMATVECEPHEAACFMRQGESQALTAQRQIIQWRLRRWSGNRGMFPLEPGTWLAEKWRNGAAVTRSQSFVVAAGARVSVTPTEAIPIPYLSGKIVDARTDKPLPYATLAILEGTISLPSASWPAAAQTALNGRFRLARPRGDTGVLLIRSPQHEPKMVPLASLADLENTAIKLSAGGALEVHVRLDSGEAVTDMSIAALSDGGRGQILLTTTNRRGIARFEPIAPGLHHIMLVPGECSFPLDSWRWLHKHSGARPIKVESKGHLSRMEWRIASNSARRIHVDLGRELNDCTLQVKPVSGAAHPGLWFDQRWRGIQTGLLDTPWLFPGQYRAIATTEEFVSIVDFEVRSMDDVPRVVFEFRKRN